MSKILPDGVYIVRDKRLYKVDFYEPIFENCKTVNVEIPNFEVLPMTNADRIRNMSDERLASLFGNTCDCDNACCFIHNEGVSCMNGCEAAWLEWLKKEVEE